MEITESKKAFISSKINLELIDKLKELSIQYLNNGNKLSYIVNLGHHDLVMGSFQTQTEIVPNRLKGIELEIFLERLNLIPKDWIHFINFYDAYFEKIKSDFINGKKIKYGIRLYKTICSDQRGKPINKIGQKKLVSQLSELFPNEEIYIIIN